MRQRSMNARRRALPSCLKCRALRLNGRPIRRSRISGRAQLSRQCVSFFGKGIRWPVHNEGESSAPGPGEARRTLCRYAQADRDGLDADQCRGAAPSTASDLARRAARSARQACRQEIAFGVCAVSLLSFAESSYSVPGGHSIRAPVYPDKSHRRRQIVRLRYQVPGNHPLRAAVSLGVLGLRRSIACI